MTRPAGTAEPPTIDPVDPRAALHRLRAEVAKAVVGQDAVVTGLVIALLCRGHVLLEGVPGVAKTLLIRTVAAALDLETKRVQFTPDLMPGDVTGSLIFDAAHRRLHLPRGAGLHQPAARRRDQPDAAEDPGGAAGGDGGAAGLGGGRAAPAARAVHRRRHPEPDRVRGHLPAARGAARPVPAQAHRAAARPGRGAGRAPRAPRRLRPARPAAAGVRPVATAADLAAARAAVGRVHVAEPLLGYVVDLCRATRNAPALELGASPRGATALLNTAKACAWLAGRDYVIPDDVKAVARPTLRHRLRLRPEAELEGVDRRRGAGHGARHRADAAMTWSGRRSCRRSAR